MVVGDDPMISCVPLDALQQLRPVFASTTSVIWVWQRGPQSSSGL